MNETSSLNRRTALWNQPYDGMDLQPRLSQNHLPGKETREIGGTTRPTSRNGASWVKAMKRTASVSWLHPRRINRDGIRRIDGTAMCGYKVESHGADLTTGCASTNTSANTT